MAPKKARPSKDPIFVSESAQGRFHEAIEKKKTFIAERSFKIELEEGSRHWFLSEVRDRGWERFCAPRESAMTAVVKEFYANVPEHQDGQVRVRGKVVHFDGATINRLFELPTPDVDEYDEFASGEFTQEKAELVCSVLTAQRGSWEMHRGEYISIKQQFLKYDANVWFYFVASTMMPVTNLHFCWREQAILIYAILAGKSINVGNLIHKGILQAASPKEGFWFPSLVTLLCRRAGVVIAANEEILLLGKIMTEKYIEKLCKPSARDGNSRLANTSRHTLPTGSTSHIEETHMEVLIRQLQRDNTVRNMYVEECFKRVEDMFRFHGAAAGIDITGHHSIPTWPSYQQTAQLPSEDGATEEEQSSLEDNSND